MLVLNLNSNVPEIFIFINILIGYIWSEGGYCMGNWLNGKRNGEGEEHWADGGWYKGEYKDDKYDGYGQRYYNHGRLHEGKWEKGYLETWGQINDEKKKDCNVF